MIVRPTSYERNRALLEGCVDRAVCAGVLTTAGTRLVVVPLAAALLAGHVLLVSALAFDRVAGSCLFTVHL